MKTQLHKLITVDPKVRFGKPVIKGTRVPVDLVVSKIAGGETVEGVGKEYGLTRDQVLAALKYAADIISSEEVSFT